MDNIDETSPFIETDKPADYSNFFIGAAVVTVVIIIIVIIYIATREAYTSIGCYKDQNNRAIPTNEGSSPILDGAYSARQDAIKKCYTVAKAKGDKIFALQDGGWCASAPDENSYNKYGAATNCSNGLGGGWANDVYRIN